VPHQFASLEIPNQIVSAAAISPYLDLCKVVGVTESHSEKSWDLGNCFGWWYAPGLELLIRHLWDVGNYTESKGYRRYRQYLICSRHTFRKSRTYRGREPPLTRKLCEEKIVMFIVARLCPSPWLWNGILSTRYYLPNISSSTPPIVLNRLTSQQPFVTQTPPLM